MSRPRLLDLFCCEGGATAGYQAAGFHVTGVDIDPQPAYPGDAFVHGDAIEYLALHGHEYDAIAGSPPCQAYTPLNAYNHKSYPDLVAVTRAAMIRTGRPYVIENVPQAPLRDPVVLCGAMFGLNLYRHRAFETGNGFTFTPPTHPAHQWRCVRNGYLPTRERPFMSIHGGKHSRAWKERAAAELQIPWATSIRNVCEAIPPAYTHHIGHAVLHHVLTNEMETAA